MECDNVQHSVFGRYASAYDVLYADKDYDVECSFLQDIFQLYGRGEIRRILDLGCGTGNHAVRLAERGYYVHGIDRSGEMLRIARIKAENSLVRNRLRFDQGNIQQISLGISFDAVICMFAVISYQTSDHALVSTFKTARNHLNNGGLFVADFWYGPAVLRQRPAKRVKEVTCEHETIVRYAHPVMDTKDNIVHVHYGFEKAYGAKKLEDYKERHSMRYFFKPEIEHFLSRTGLTMKRFCSFGDIHKDADDTTWNAMVIARKP